MTENVKCISQPDNETAPDSHLYYFHQGTDYCAYEYLGCHRTSCGYVFRTWAPRAAEIFVAGDFNGWAHDIPMKKISRDGVWEAYINRTDINGMNYKYIVVSDSDDGQKTSYKSDPYAFYDETLENTATANGYNPAKITTAVLTFIRSR